MWSYPVFTSNLVIGYDLAGMLALLALACACSPTVSRVLPGLFPSLRSGTLLLLASCVDYTGHYDRACLLTSLWQPMRTGFRNHSSLQS